MRALFMETDSFNLDAQGYIVYEIRNPKNLSESCLGPIQHLRWAFFVLPIFTK